MSKNRPSLDRINTYDKKSDDLTVIIETPKGSRSKYAYDPEIGTFTLKFVLPEGMTFPVDFGFVPSTQARMAIRSTSSSCSTRALQSGRR